MNKKLEVNITFQGDTIKKIESLQNLLGGIDYEQIVIMAINLLYQENIIKFGDRLLPNEEGNYFLQVGNTIIAEVLPDALDFMDKDILQKMLKEGVIGGFSQVIKSAIQAEKKIKIVD